MRPEILFPLFAPVTKLPGVGPRIGKVIEGLAGPHIVDLFWLFPTGLIDRSYAPKLAEAEAGRIATLTLRIDAHEPPPTRRLPYRVHGSDDTGEITLVFFHGRADYLQRTLPEGETRVVSGRVEEFRNRLQIVHPDLIAKPEETDERQAIEPVYPLTAGLTRKPLAKAIAGALARAPELGEWLDASLVKRENWPAWREALLAVHHPKAEGDLAASTPARTRLAYDELLANQLALGLLRLHLRQSKGRPVRGDGAIRKRVNQQLPFKLTASQGEALKEIDADMAANQRMLRLLQGDVGSGKTVVALLAMLSAVETGAQAVLMAPTEILARQHFATVQTLLAGSGVEVALLTGREKGAQRKQIFADLAEGRTAIAVGTHALFQEDVAFRELAFVVIDEQHRFGVHQRLTLASKGRAVDTLVMTATPIPRTLTLTVYGDLEVSRLTEKPAGRPPVDTRLIPVGRLNDVIAAVRRAMEKGRRVFWVCPLVEESEVLDVAAAEDRFAALKAIFGNRVGLLHGRMKGKEKDAAMAAFLDGRIRLLVATTVVEVGVDVPEATVMVIEHAERFGLAQLHQLRGRIGRGHEASTCLLLYASPLSAPAKARLKILRETDDGFRIAEEDLRLRGSGEVLGTRQSGLPLFRIADPARHEELMTMAYDDARLILERDPDLQKPRGAALRVLLYLFERDAAVKYLRSG
ncbi:MAG: ATP-dependent DNA helicase RecG [Alphaproteobacteria bacterium]|nr:ATP-dependent DNA helicase RecG [Alphaproteobacteria bacterium]